jgi:opacity protein-like surface antigen
MNIQLAVVALSLLMAPSAAWAAQETGAERQAARVVEPAPAIELKEYDPRLRARHGLEFQAGYTNFTGDLGEALGDGANWALRAIFNTHRHVGAEVAYYGATSSIEDSDRNAVSSSFESLARFHFLKSTHRIQPFAGAGVSWFRLVSTREEALLPTDDGDLATSLHSLAIPLAAGVSFYPQRNLSLGLRGEYRLLTNAFGSRTPSGDSYSISLTLGFIH